MRKKAKAKSIEQWQRLNEGYEASGLTIKEFSQKRGVNWSTLKWWRKKFKRQVACESSKAPPLMFREIALPQKRSEAEYSVMLHGDRELRIGSGFAPSDVSELIRILESC